ncbi:phytoene desaturase family protein [Aureispira anguillae]|uniref:NAD(P)/FAD-dependent oxidoreductase n=1 Tax=Aureispira anguillae TaxID=2864201 RepID=A0A916DU27_9BACT|nr:NAD(P)/FAD-dependent oxidoreductase [Aureispira anguillae]BDS13779.1 NAD(P)/FAD-dependent oxidoreductase [Aureispira anguillae]
MKKEYDSIVIGSGIGGLSTAALLSKAYNQKVLVLEKHWTLGGLTHEFEREGNYSWDVGVHYLGAMEAGELPYDIFDYISDGQLKWDKINDPYDIFWYPDLKFGAVSGAKNLKADLIKQFPEEQKAINQYFKDIQKAVNWGRDRFLSISLPKPVASIPKFLAKRKEDFFLQSAQSYFDSHFKNNQLKSLLLSQWGDYGIAPSKAVFWVHASVVAHYMEGAYYPKGGAKKIAETIVPVIKRSGGECLTNCEVGEIIIEDNKAVGVRYRQRKGKRWVHRTVYASNIISNVGAKNTFQSLLRAPIHPEINQLKGEATAITIYLGLKENPASKFNVNGGNFWFFEDYNHNKMATNQELINGNIDMCFLSFPSLKDRSKTAHTAEIVAFAPYEAFQAWSDTSWQNRGESYQTLKNKIATAFLAYIDKKLEGFSDMVSFVEVSTPLSLEQFTNRKGGAMYGLPCTKERFQMECLQPRTSIKNLYLSGGDVFMLGVCGALLGGLASASLVGSKFGIASLFPKIMMELKKQRGANHKEGATTKKGIPKLETSY